MFDSCLNRWFHQLKVSVQAEHFVGSECHELPILLPVVMGDKFCRSPKNGSFRSSGLLHRIEIFGRFFSLPSRHLTKNIGWMPPATFIVVVYHFANRRELAVQKSLDSLSREVGLRTRR